MSPEQEEMLLKIGRKAALDSRLDDKEEAFSVALVGIAKGLKTYTSTRKVKLTTYLYRCAQMECWAEWRRTHRQKRNQLKEVSLEGLQEQGRQL